MLGFKKKTPPPEVVEHTATPIHGAAGTGDHDDIKTNLSEFTAEAAKSIFDTNGKHYVTQNAQAILNNFFGCAPLYSIIRDVASTFSTIKVGVYDIKGNEIDDAAIMELIEFPRPGISAKQWRLEMMCDYLLFGCCFADTEIHRGGMGPATKALLNGKPKIDMYRIAAPAVQSESNDSSLLPSAFYLENGKFKRPVNPATGKCGMFWLFDYHPYLTRDHHVMSSVRPGMISAETHSAMTRHNRLLAKNYFRPSFVFRPDTAASGASAGFFSETQLKEAGERLINKWKAAIGSPIVTSEIKPDKMTMDNVEADFNNSKDSAARDVAMAYQYPTQLMSLPDSQTYRNFQEGRANFITRSVLPIAERFWDGFAVWASAYFGKRILIKVLKNEIQAIALQNAAVMSQINAVEFLTLNEKRNLVGMPPSKEPHADKILVKGGMMTGEDAITQLEEGEEEKQLDDKKTKKKGLE